MAVKASGLLVRVDYDAMIKDLESKEFALRAELEKIQKVCCCRCCV